MDGKHEKTRFSRNFAKNVTFWTVLEKNALQFNLKKLQKPRNSPFLDSNRHFRLENSFWGCPFIESLTATEPFWDPPDVPYFDRLRRSDLQWSWISWSDLRWPRNHQISVKKIIPFFKTRFLEAQEEFEYNFWCFEKLRTCIFMW